MWELDYKESWAPKNWCFWTVVLGKTLDRPLDFKEIQPVHPKRDQSSVFIGRTDAEAETPIVWPHDAKSWFIWKDPDAGKDWGQEEKGMTEDEMVWWHHWLNGHGFGYTLAVGDGQGVLECCGLLGRRVRHDWATELNWKVAQTRLSVHFLTFKPLASWKPVLESILSEYLNWEKSTPNRQQGHGKHAEWVQNSNNN